MHDGLCGSALYRMEHGPWGDEMYAARRANSSSPNLPRVSLNQVHYYSYAANDGVNFSQELDNLALLIVVWLSTERSLQDLRGALSEDWVPVHRFKMQA